jgi:hypothetical protein
MTLNPRDRGSSPWRRTRDLLKYLSHVILVGCQLQFCQRRGFGPGEDHNQI